MIVVMGAGGRLGGAVVAELLERVSPAELGVSTTRPEELGDLEARGVRVRRASYDDPASLSAAFEGADRVLVVSAPRIGGPAIAAHEAAIAAARDAGVGRVLYTSHVGSDALSPFPPATTHATTEVLLRESGLAFTSLRNGFYADTPVQLLAGALRTGELRTPVDGPVSWTQHRDLAPATATLLLDPDLSEPAVNLTAGEAVTMSELADLASSLLGRPVRHVVLGDEEHRAELLASGMPEMRVNMTQGIFRASRQRHLGIVDPTLADLLGRPTTPLSQLLREELAGA